MATHLFVSWRHAASSVGISVVGQRPLAVSDLPPILLLAITGFQDGQKQAGKAPLAQAFEGFQRTGAFAAISVMQATLYQPGHFWRGPHGQQLH